MSRARPSRQSSPTPGALHRARQRAEAEVLARDLEQLAADVRRHGCREWRWDQDAEMVEVHDERYRLPIDIDPRTGAINHKIRVRGLDTATSRLDVWSEDDFAALYASDDPPGEVVHEYPDDYVDATPFSAPDGGPLSPTLRTCTWWGGRRRRWVQVDGGWEETQ